mgnify:CR=1 FL=1
MLNTLENIFNLARERKKSPIEGSYTNKLLSNKSLSKAKVIEEINELLELEVKVWTKYVSRAFKTELYRNEKNNMKDTELQEINETVNEENRQLKRCETRSKRIICFLSVLITISYGP